MSYNCVFVIGPTAVGKTAIGVRLADKFNGEIISADSRQVYKGLDIGTGKDLADYDFVGSDGKQKHIPYHIIDVCDLSKEYNLFDFQTDFYNAFSDITSRGKLPICVGGTGMYVDSILRQYDMIEVPENESEKKELESKSYDELKSILIAEKKKLHNTSEFGDKERIIKAIQINRFTKSDEYALLKKKMQESRPKIEPLVICTTLERNLVRERIAARLKARIDEGLVEEVDSLHKSGWSFERLESLGLEYRFVSEYLLGKYGKVGSSDAKGKLFELLNLAIGQFAKRQETWFRGMEKKGVKINWLPKDMDVGVRFDAACELLENSK